MKIVVVDVSQRQIDEALAETKATLRAETSAVLEQVVHAYSTVLSELERRETTIGRLRRMLFGSGSEKIAKVLAKQGQAQGTETTEVPAGGKARPPGRPLPGHGRNGQNAYPGAKTQCVSHHKLKPGDRCPACGKGRVYEQRDRPKESAGNHFFAGRAGTLSTNEK